MKNKLAAALLGAAAFACLAPAAMAADGFTGKSAGDVMARLRGIGVIPQESSSIEPIGGHVDASNTIVPEADFSYFLTDNIALELILATTPHDVKAKGTAAGDIDLGSVWLLPPTLTAQYHFLPKSDISPYLGAGVNYTIFYGVDSPSGLSMHYDNAFGAALQAGLDVHLGGNWYANLDVKQLFLSTTAKVNGGAVKADVDLNPTIVGLGIAYKFTP